MIDDQEFTRQVRRRLAERRQPRPSAAVLLVVALVAAAVLWIAIGGALAWLILRLFGA
jgi:hypothetical protein